MYVYLAKICLQSRQNVDENWKPHPCSLNRFQMVSNSVIYEYRNNTFSNSRMEILLYLTSSGENYSLWVSHLEVQFTFGVADVTLLKEMNGSNLKNIDV